MNWFPFADMNGLDSSYLKSVTPSYAPSNSPHPPNVSHIVRNNNAYVPNISTVNDPSIGSNSIIANNVIYSSSTYNNVNNNINSILPGRRISKNNLPNGHHSISDSSKHNFPILKNSMERPNIPQSPAINNMHCESSMMPPPCQPPNNVPPQSPSLPQNFHPRGSVNSHPPQSLNAPPLQHPQSSNAPQSFNSPQLLNDPSLQDGSPQLSTPLASMRPLKYAHVNVCEIFPEFRMDQVSILSTVLFYKLFLIRK